MKAHGGVDVQIHIFFLHRHQLNVSGQLHVPAALTPEESTPGTHWIRGWVDPRVSLDDVEQRKLVTLQGLELRPSIIKPVASRYTVRQWIWRKQTYVTSIIANTGVCEWSEYIRGCPQSLNNVP
jgi:hypothetical protein